MQEGAERADNEASLLGETGDIRALLSDSRPHTGTDGAASARSVLPRERPSPATAEPRTGAGPGLGRGPQRSPRGRGSEATPHPPGSERRRCRRCRRSEIHQNKIKNLSKPPPFFAKDKCGARVGSPRALRTGAAGTGSVLRRLPRFSFYFLRPRRYRRAEPGCSQRGGGRGFSDGGSRNRFILTLLFAIFARRSFRDPGATLKPPLERSALKNKPKINQTSTAPER